MKSFGWENISYYCVGNVISYVRMFPNDYCAAQIIKLQKDKKYSCIFPTNEKMNKSFKLFSAAKRYCNKTLELMGIGLLDECYRVLI
jgi:hypothetical protein